MEFTIQFDSVEDARVVQEVLQRSHRAALNMYDHDKAEILLYVVDELTAEIDAHTEE